MATVFCNLYEEILMGHLKQQDKTWNEGYKFFNHLVNILIK